jgi:hypothetical protein
MIRVVVIAFVLIISIPCAGEEDQRIGREELAIW